MSMKKVEFKSGSRMLRGAGFGFIAPCCTRSARSPARTAPDRHFQPDERMPWTISSSTSVKSPSEANLRSSTSARSFNFPRRAASTRSGAGYRSRGLPQRRSGTRRSIPTRRRSAGSRHCLPAPAHRSAPQQPRPHVEQALPRHHPDHDEAGRQQRAMAGGGRPRPASDFARERSPVGGLSTPCQPGLQAIG